MPFYDYECDNCKTVTEFQHGMLDKPKKTCPACKKRKLRRIFNAPSFIDKFDPKTIGALGEKNWKKLGKNRQEIKDVEFGFKETREKLAEKERMNKIAKMTDEQMKRYIVKGEGLD